MSTVVPRLPLELQQHVMMLSLPPLSPVRSALLRKYSLTSRSWRVFAQTELFRHVHLDTCTRAIDFVSTIGKDDDLKYLVRTIKIGKDSVRIEGAGDDTQTAVDEEGPKEWSSSSCSAIMFKLGYLLSKCLRLEELSLSNVFLRLDELNGGKGSCRSALNCLQNVVGRFVLTVVVVSLIYSVDDHEKQPSALRKLYITDSEIVPAPFSFLYLPTLRHLSLDRCSIHGTSTFFARGHLPALSALSVDYTTPSFFPVRLTPVTATGFSEEAAGIRVVSEYAFEREDLSSSKFVLVESTAELLGNVERLRSLPPTVKVLRVLNWNDEKRIDEEESRLSLFCKAAEVYLSMEEGKRLEEVCLANEGRVGRVEKSKEQKEVLAKLEQLCQKRGVRFNKEKKGTEEKGLGFWRKVGEVERGW